MRPVDSQSTIGVPCGAPGPGPRLLGKRLRRGFQGEEAEGGSGGPKDREGSKRARQIPYPPPLYQCSRLCRGHVGILGPKNSSDGLYSLGERTFAKGPGRPGSGRHLAPGIIVYHSAAPHEGSWPPELGKGCGGRLVGLSVFYSTFSPLPHFPAE